MKILEYNNLNVDGLSSKYKRVLSFIEQDDFYSAQVKKLKSKPYYTARLDITNRILFDVIKYNGQKHALILEIIHNHNYQGSRFLNGSKVIEEEIKEIEVENPQEELKFIMKNLINYIF